MMIFFDNNNISNEIINRQCNAKNDNIDKIDDENDNNSNKQSNDIHDSNYNKNDKLY